MPKSNTFVRYTKYVQRPVSAFFRMPGSQGFGLLLIVFFSIVVLSVIDLRQNYIHPETNQRLDTFAAVYAVFALLVFETPLPLPASWITRLVFFAVPISGILVVGQGLVRLGSVFLNKDIWSSAMASTYAEHTIVCGLGKVSLRVVRWILDLNEEVVVVDNRRDNPYLEQVRDWGVPVVIGDARRSEVLEQVGIRVAESIVSGTNDDLTNLSIALRARRLAPNIKVVLRMFDTDMAENVRLGFDIHTAFSIPEIAAPTFAAAATKAPLDHAITYHDGGETGLLTITKFVLVPESPLVGFTVGRLEDEFDVAVIAHRQKGKFTLHPSDEATLLADDRFIVSASIPALNQIARFTPPLREIERYQQGRWPIESELKPRRNKKRATKR